MTGNDTNAKGITMETKYFSFSVCYQLPNCQCETIVQARSKDEAKAKVLAWQPTASAIRWVIEVDGVRGWL
jgi:hypothetical protein